MAMKASMHNWMRPEPIQATIERLGSIAHLRAALGAAV